MADTQATANSNGAQAQVSPLRSVLSNWIGLFVSATISLVMTPILIHGLGDLYYGMWVLIATFLDSYGLLDFGVRNALFRFVALYKGSNQRRALNSILSSGFMIALTTAAIVLLLTVLSVAFLPAFFNVEGSSRHIFRWLVALLGTGVAFAFPAQFLGTYLCACRRFDLFNFTIILTGVLRAGLIILVLRLHHGVIAVGAITFGATVLSFLLNLYLVHRSDPEVSLRPSLAERARVKELLSFSVYAFIGNIGDQLRFFVDNIVIGRVLVIALITPFNIAGRLMMLMRQLLISLASPLSGVMAELEGKDMQDELRDYFLHATRLTSILSFYVGFILLVNGRNIITLWVGPDYQESYLLLVLLIAGYCIMLAQHPSVDLLMAKHRHQPRGWWTLAEGVANLILSIVLARRYGLIGVAIGTTIPMLIVQFFVQPWYTLAISGISPRRYLREALLGPFIAAAIFLAVCWLLRSTQAVASLPRLFLSVAWQSVVFGALAYAFAMKGEERGRLLAGMQKLKSIVFGSRA